MGVTLGTTPFVVRQSRQDEGDPPREECQPRNQDRHVSGPGDPLHSAVKCWAHPGAEPGMGPCADHRSALSTRESRTGLALSVVRLSAKDAGAKQLIRNPGEWLVWRLRRIVW
jgi:hypothetical protein